MEKFIYLLAKREKLVIDISQYVTFILKNTKKGVTYHIDNHFAFNKNQYDTMADKKMLEGVLDVKQVREFVDTEFAKELQIAKNKADAKNNFLYEIQWNENIAPENKILLEEIADFVEETGSFNLTKNVSLKITGENSRNINPFEDLKFSIAVKQSKNGKEKSHCPEMPSEEMIKIVNNIVETNYKTIQENLDEAKYAVSAKNQEKEKQYKNLMKKFCSKSKEREM